MDTQAPSRPTRESEIVALGRALALEKRARYIDVQGKRSTFAKFMRQTAERLCRRYPYDSKWSTIKGLFQQYPNLDLAARISMVRRTEELLFGALNPVLNSPSPAGQNVSVVTPAAGAVSGQKAVASTLSADITGGKDKNTDQKEEPDSGLNKVSSDGIFKEASFKNFESSSENFKEQAKKGPVMRAPSGHQDKGGLNSRSPLPEAKRPEKGDPAVTDPQQVAIQYLRGCGPKNAELLEKLGIYTVLDLLKHFPRQHLDFQDRQKINSLVLGQDVTIFGTIRSVSAYQPKRGNISIVNVTVNDGTGSILISKFIGGKGNRFLLERYKDNFPKGAQVMASGRVEKDKYSGRLSLKNASVEVLGALSSNEEDVVSLHAGRLVPVYPLTEGLSLRHLRNMIYVALEGYDQKIPDIVPDFIQAEYELCPVQEALWGIHFPENFALKERARRRLVFDELFIAQIQLAARRYKYEQDTAGLSLDTGKSVFINRFMADLPFQLTGAQKRVFAEISRDLSSPHPMHRLVQGDVGSGKTVVAALTALLAIENGFQVAVMAPTEILAEQHYRQFQRWLMPLGLKVGLFLGKQGIKERRKVQAELFSGQIHVAVGTHALIQEDVEFQKLGLVIIDEQHRFGVKQRAALKGKGVNPELLTMTATPIPRTLALALHGDLELSEIDELPPGRKPIKTEYFYPGERKIVYQKMREQIFAGRQVYYVFPLIEESETLSAKAAAAEYEKFCSEIFTEYAIGLMHGKLKPQEKEEVMDKFRAGQYQILVSTTVIEVGVDVPNATVMVIENADRFGLSQLHQLRGRVGRGGEQSYCFLIADAKGGATRQRLEIMCQTNDGFVIAEKDLELRGPGEFLGTRQSGLPDMVLADLVKDAKILEEARNAAITVVKGDPELKQYPLLKEIIQQGQKSEKAEMLRSG